MSTAPARPRPTWLQRVLWVLFPILMIYNGLNALEYVRDLPGVQTWRAHRTGLPVYPSRRAGLYEGLDRASRSPDGRWVASGGAREYGRSFTFRVVLWNAAKIERRWVTDRSTDDFRHVNELVWSPDSRTLWTHDTEGKVDTLDVATGRVIREFQADQYRPCVFVSTPGGLLLTEQAGPQAPTELTLRRWQDGEVQWRVPLPCWDAAAGSVDAAGRTLAYSPRSGEVALFDLRRRTRLAPVLTLPKDFGPYAIALAPNGRQVAAGGGEGTVVAWSTASGQEAWRTRPHQGLVIALAWNAESTALASSGFDGCGGWRSECVVVTRPGPAGPQSRVVWWRRYRAAQTVEWVFDDRLLIADNSGARTLRVPE